MYHHHFTPRTTKGRFEVVMAVIRDMVLYSLISPDEGGNRILWNRIYFCQTVWHYICEQNRTLEL